MKERRAFPPDGHPYDDPPYVTRKPDSLPHRIASAAITWLFFIVMGWGLLYVGFTLVLAWLWWR